MKKYPFFRQIDSIDCGASCLAMIASFYKIKFSLSELRNSCEIGKNGLSILGVCDAAETLGLKTRAVKIDFNSLIRNVQFPAIIHWNQNHFVVAFKIRKKTIAIADPAKGFCMYTYEEFKNYWLGDRNVNNQGIVILIDISQGNKRKKFENSVRSEGSFSQILKYLLPFRRLVVQLFIGLLLGSLLQLLLPFLTQSIVDQGINSADLSFIKIILFAQVALLVGRVIIDFVRSWILLHISTRINISILSDFLFKLLKLPISFFDSKNTGDILQRMNDHNRIESFLTSSSLNSLFALTNIIVFSIVLFLYDYSVFAVFAVGSILYSIWVFIFLKRRRNLDLRRFEISSLEQSSAIQLIQGMQEIKLNGIETSMRNKWESLQVSAFNLKIKSLSIDQIQQIGAFFINEGKNVVITFLSAKAVLMGDLSLGSMLAIQYIVGQLNSPVSQLVGLVQNYQNAKLSFERLSEIHQISDEDVLAESLATKISLEKNYVFANSGIPSPSLIHRSEKRNNIHESEEIRISNLSFKYPGSGNDLVLKDLSINLPIGKTTAIVGTSGSGKTTLLKILLKFYHPQSGNISLRRTPFEMIGTRNWRRICGVVMQESYIFSDTIANNIALTNSVIDVHKLNNALNIANALEFVNRLPLGLDTKIGPDGTNISMGQRQRILIARAIYKDPEYIFLDEATNSLDALNESIITQNLETFCAGRTVLVVAHRLSTVKNAHQIIVLDGGRVSEVGSHAELISRKGVYFRLISNQLELAN